MTETVDKPPLKPKHEAVLQFLRTFRDPRTGQCTPTVAEIGTAVGVGRDRARKIVSDLVSAKRVERVEGWQWDAGDHFVFTTDYWEAKHQGADGNGGHYRGPNLYRVIGLMLLLFVLVSPTVSAAPSVSVVEALCLFLIIYLCLLLRRAK